MKQAFLHTEKDFALCDIDPRVYGSFVEHMGRVVHTGIYEPGHPTADANGFRGDVLALAKQLGLSVVRYPGGNFTSAYRWEDTVGPIGERMPTLDVAWKAIEPNTFGLPEFLAWAKLVGAAPIMTLNLGTRGVEDAKNLVEYCNFAGVTRYSELRRSHGHEKPFGIRTWCLGNELDGHWQVAGKTAGEYGRLANETSKVVKWIDPAAETIAVGSSTPRMATYPEWDRQVLMECYDNVDYLALHNYINRAQDDGLAHPNARAADSVGTYLSRAVAFDRQISEIVAACDYVKAVKRSGKTMYLAFDEWNVHRHPEQPYEQWRTGSPIDWCHFDMADTLLFGGMLLAILRHADRVKIACQSLLVNTIPLILTRAGGAAWVNPTYHVFAQASHHGRGRLLHAAMDCPLYDSGAYDAVPEVDHVAIQNEKDITIFALNRSGEAFLLESRLGGFAPTRILEHTVLCADVLDATNTEEAPGRLQPRPTNGSTLEDGRVRSALPPYSWNMVRIEIRSN